jgi:energy-coupling factor transporter ATP-binding protein EcfA2
MSLYVTWINLIKEKADESWLTDSQREVYRQLLARWQSHPFVNLYGPAGSGKSFIARLLARVHGYAYTRALEEAPTGTSQVIVDDAVYSRLMRPLARERGLGRVVLITRRPVSESMPSLELALNPRDMRQFQAILSERCGISFLHTIPDHLDLTQAIQDEVVARGATHVHP